MCPAGRLGAAGAAATAATGCGAAGGGMFIHWGMDIGAEAGPEIGRAHV